MPIPRVTQPCSEVLLLPSMSLTSGQCPYHSKLSGVPQSVSRRHTASEPSMLHNTNRNPPVVAPLLSISSGFYFTECSARLENRSWTYEEKESTWTIPPGVTASSQGSSSLSASSQGSSSPSATCVSSTSVFLTMALTMWHECQRKMQWETSPILADKPLIEAFFSHNVVPVCPRKLSHCIAQHNSPFTAADHRRKKFQKMFPGVKFFNNTHIQRHTTDRKIMCRLSVTYLQFRSLLQGTARYFRNRQCSKAIVARSPFRMTSIRPKPKERNVSSFTVVTI